MRTWKLFIAVFLISLPLIYGLNAIAAIPGSYDQYLALYTLGSGGLTEQYFPKGASNILPGTQLSWYVGVYNHMGGVRLVKVEFKLLNDTMQGPSQVNGAPSQRSAFFEETHLLLANETWTVPFTWSVDNATETLDGTMINSIMFNTQLLTDNVQLFALHGFNFRMVVELWVYDEAAGNYSFQWNGNGNLEVAWNQIWFNMTRVSLLPS
jgi:hypothetical protein